MKFKFKVFLPVILILTAFSAVIFLAFKKYQEDQDLRDYSVEIPNILTQNAQKNDPVPILAGPEVKKFKFAIFGDSHFREEDEYEKDLKEIVDQIKKQKVDFVIAAGDNIADCEKKECKKRLTNWKKTLGDLSEKIFPAWGNHDFSPKPEYAAEQFQKAFALPSNGPEDFKELTYSFDYGNTHFVILTTNLPKDHLINDKQLNWLKLDLDRNKQKFTFVFFHEPAFPVSEKKNEGLDVEKKQRDKFWQILDDHKVTATFSAHEHLHSRLKVDGQVFSGAQSSIYQFVVGNAGYFEHEEANKKTIGLEYQHKGEVFMIVEIDDSNILTKLYSDEGVILETFKLPTT